MAYDRWTDPPLVLPADPAGAIEVLREQQVEVEPIVSLEPSQELTYNAVATRLRSDHPQLVEQLGPHRDRALLGLFGVLKTCVATDGESLLTHPDRVMPLAVEFLGRVGLAMGGQVDPVTKVLYPDTRSRDPTLEPKFNLNLDLPEAIQKADSLFEQEPGTLLAGLQTSILNHQLTMDGSMRRSHEITLQLVRGELLTLGFTTGQATEVAYNYVKAMGRYTRLMTGISDPPAMTAGRLRPHLHHYLEQAVTLDRMHFPQPHARALAYSPEDLDNLYTEWVTRNGLPAWAFHAAVEGGITNIDTYLRGLPPTVPPYRWITTPPELTSFGRQAGASKGAPSRPAQSVDYNDVIERVRNYPTLSSLMRKVNYIDATALAVVYDLNLRGSEAIDVPKLAARLKVPVTKLVAYVENRVLPRFS